MGAIQREEEHDKVFDCNDTAQITSEFCRISRRRISALKEKLLQL